MFDFSEIVDILDFDHYSAEIGVQTWRGVELDELCRYFESDAETLLKAMRLVASRYPMRYGEKKCASCGMPIRFRDRKPYDRENMNHFIACPNRAAHRKKG